MWCLILNFDDLLNKIKNVHLIGIGGSGMCPIAEILASKKYNITGSDNYKSDTLERIEKKYNFKIYNKHEKENIKNNTELVVYSAAIKQDNPEILSAKEKNIPIIERSAMLGVITRKYKNCIAISGTHGKTTTSAMITQILTESNLDPTAIIGAEFKYISGNSRVGNSENIICEACEYVDSFLELSPDLSIILNIDIDHLDYFKNLENII